MAMSEGEISRNAQYWAQYFPANEAAALAHKGGARTVFYTYLEGSRTGKRVTGADMLAQQKRFVENIRQQKRFSKQAFRLEKRRGRDGVVRTVRVRNITESMKRLASQRRDSLVKAQIADTVAVKAFLKIHFPDTP